MPHLKMKAHTSLQVIDWLSKVCCDRVANVSADEYEVDRASLLWGLSEMFQIWRTAGTWLTRSQLRDLRIARDAFFFASWKMCRLHEETETFLYKLLPKHYKIDHAERSCQETVEPMQLLDIQRRKQHGSHVRHLSSVPCDN